MAACTLNLTIISNKTLCFLIACLQNTYLLNQKEKKCSTRSDKLTLIEKLKIVIHYVTQLLSFIQQPTRNVSSQNKAEKLE